MGAITEWVRLGTLVWCAVFLTGIAAANSWRHATAAEIAAPVLREPNVGDRVRFVTGDLKGETGVITALPEDGSELYAIVLDSDGTRVLATSDRFELC